MKIISMSTTYGKRRVAPVVGMPHGRPDQAPASACRTGVLSSPMRRLAASLALKVMSGALILFDVDNHEVNRCNGKAEDGHAKSLVLFSFEIQRGDGMDSIPVLDITIGIDDTGSEGQPFENRSVDDLRQTLLPR